MCFCSLTRRDTVALVLSLSWGSVGRLFHTMWGVSYLSRSFGQLLNRKSMTKNFIPAYRPRGERVRKGENKYRIKKRMKKNNFTFQGLPVFSLLSLSIQVPFVVQSFVSFIQFISSTFQSFFFFYKSNMLEQDGVLNGYWYSQCLGLTSNKNKPWVMMSILQSRVGWGVSSLN